MFIDAARCRVQEWNGVAGIDGIAPKPGHKAIRIGADGAPWIEGYRCGECGAVVAEQTMACRACGARPGPAGYAAANRGALYSWSVVQRSYPGVAVPFVSAIVDLDCGLTLKGTLKDALKDGGGDSLRMGLPVRLVFDDAGGARDKEGAPYIGFHFVPEGDAA